MVFEVEVVTTETVTLEKPNILEAAKAVHDLQKKFETGSHHGEKVVVKLKAIPGNLLCKCTECGNNFYLTADSEMRHGEVRCTYVRYRSCESDGIYAADIDCPWCDCSYDVK